MDRKTRVEILSQLLGKCFDIEVRDIEGEKGTITLVYADVIVDKDILARDLVTPLQDMLDATSPTLEKVVESILTPARITEAHDLKEASVKVADGSIAIITDSGVLLTVLKKVAHRPVGEPPTGTSVKGPREGFTEELRANVSLLRRKLKTPMLTLEKHVVGKYTRTDVVICYLRGIADEEIIGKVRDKVVGIDIDGVLDASYISHYLEEEPDSIFRHTGTTEKPDILAGKLLEGRVAILVDGSPIALTLPFLFIEDMQDGDDYYKKDYRITFERIVRLIGATMAVIIPAIYVALQEFQYQFVPLKFLITLLNATSGIPLTPTLEMLTVLLLFEVLNETSVRMPKYVGMAISVVGAIVLGDTAVNAGLLGSPAVLVTAISGIGLYCVPDDAGTFSLLRLVYVCIAGVTGIFGLVLGVMVLLAYLVKSNSYGAPYLAPYAPIVREDLKDGVFFAGLDKMKYRPKSFPHHNRVRIGEEIDE